MQITFMDLKLDSFSLCKKIKLSQSPLNQVWFIFIPAVYDSIICHFNRSVMQMTEKTHIMIIIHISVDTLDQINESVPKSSLVLQTARADNTFSCCR